jgi:hypothetical protein
MIPVDALPASMRNKISIDGDCWNWTGAKNNKGYGAVTNGKGGTMLAHRKSFEVTKGEIPSGLQIDHRCRNTSCVNPNHLDAVTAKENVRRRHHGIDPKPAVAAPFGDIFEKFWGKDS